MAEQKKKKGNLTREKRKMDDIPIASNKKWKMDTCRAAAESPHQKWKMNICNTATESPHQKMEMDDIPIASTEKRKMDTCSTAAESPHLKWKMNICSTAAKSPHQKMEVDDIPIAFNKKRKMGTCSTAAESPHQKWKMDICSTATESPHQKLPHDVIVHNILTRLPVQNLAKECAFVCKLWYKSIIHPYFVSLHTSLQSCHNNRYSNLIFDILNTVSLRTTYLRQCTLRLDIDDDNDNTDVYSFRKLTDIGASRQELVGHCNGLHCLRASHVGGQCFFRIVNPSCRPKDLMAAVYPVPDEGVIIFCGFGFDSLANEYKIILVYSNSSLLSSVIDVRDKFKCMVFTLGSKSWRESTTNTLPVITTSTGIMQEKKKKRVILSRMSFSRSAIYVDGALYWRVLTREGIGGGISDEGDEEDQETEMLLCFDIHHEHFQLIFLPLECELKIKTRTTTIITEQQQQLIDHRLLEFKGSPCIVRLETGEKQQMNRNCCCKVHLYVLKDRVKSAWSRETFDVCRNTSVIQDVSSPPPCIIATTTSAATTTTTTFTTATTIAAAAATTTSTTTTSTSTTAHHPVTQVLCMSDRVILYWFDGVCVQFYDLRRKRLKMVKYTPANPTKDVGLFNREVRERLYPFDHVDGVDTTNNDKLIYCRRDHVDYKLHIYVENSLPLKTFIPKGCTVSWSYEKWCMENKEIGDGLGFVYTDGENGEPQFHCFCKRSSTDGS